MDISAEIIEGRRLDFGLEEKRLVGPLVVTSPDVDWDNFLVQSSSESDPKKDRMIFGAMRLLGGRIEGIPGRSMSVSDLKTILNPSFPDSELVISKLEEEGIILIDRALGTVSILKAPHAVLDSAYSLN